MKQQSPLTRVGVLGKREAKLFPCLLEKFLTIGNTCAHVTEPVEWFKRLINGIIIILLDCPLPRCSKILEVRVNEIVQDVTALAWNLIEHGIEPERYDIPDVGFDSDGVANLAGNPTLWFKDSEDNIMNIE